MYIGAPSAQQLATGHSVLASPRGQIGTRRGAPVALWRVR